MSKHIQPISHYPPHERIKAFLIKKILKQQSVKVSGLSSGYCMKPQSVITKAFPCHCKGAIFFHISQPKLLLASVKK